MVQTELFESPQSIQKVAWQADRQSGLNRLNAFLPNAGRAYASTRNFDFGPDNRSNISALSPWIRHRLICENEVLDATLNRHGFNAAEKFIMEVYWRAYFKGWLEQHPSVWRHYQSELAQQTSNLSKDGELNQNYINAVEGNTGIECFDYWMKELTNSGYLHNHTRMWVASIWVFTLKLPWVLGADYFYRHLLDGDPASNTLSWRWVSGLHTKGKNYVARASNIQKFTDGRYNPEGQLVENPLPLSEDWEIQQRPMPLTDQLDMQKKTGYFITEEDCSMEIVKQHTNLSAIAIVERDLSMYSNPVQSFKNGSLQDIYRSSTDYFGLNISKVKSDKILSWVQKNNLEQVVTSYIPVGFVRDTLTPVIQQLQSHGISFTQIMHQHDKNTWPHATRGFFKLRKKIPILLSHS